MTLIPVDKSAGRDDEALGACQRNFADGSTAPTVGVRRDLLELFIGYGLILLAIWTPQPMQRVFDWAALVWVLLVTGPGLEDWRAMGFRVSGSLRSLWVVGVALLLAAAAVSVAHQLHTLHLPGNPGGIVARYWGYAIWAFLQQFLLQDFVLLRLLRLLREPKVAVASAAGLFALAHLPNPILTATTVIWGYVACLLFLRYRSIYSLAVAHAIFGICVATTIPIAVNHNMRVGLGYLTFRQAANQRSQKDHIVSTAAWVMAEAPRRRS
jgi:membrane protease YdiL (CAAX protease family)